MTTYPSPRPTKYKVRPKKSASGIGLFADVDIPKKKFIIEYWGKIVTDDKADDICGKYLFELENGKTIVGTTRKNIARYANHSCRPNAEAYIVGNRVYLYSCKNIKAGDEITYDYGKEYFNHFIKPYGCRCGKCVKKDNK